ncbi:proton channel OtopLc-like [Ptychodera flava]|uniref:proton channel OtopLc-like n=1 Tax=Ptychodera flava TaxID=63121 RepID=UPI00396A4067
MSCNQAGYQAILPLDEVPRPVRRSLTTVAFSKVYGIINLVVGTVLPVAYVLQAGEKERAPHVNVFHISHLDAFYIYLFSVSILSIIVMQFSGMMGTNSCQNSHQAASNFILVGAALFGACGMLSAVFRLGSIVDGSCNEICGAVNAVEAVLAVSFILLLWLFVCANSDKCVRKWRPLARVATMLQWATCMSCWSRDFVREVMEDLAGLSFNETANCGVHAQGHSDSVISDVIINASTQQQVLSHTEEAGDGLNFHHIRDKSSLLLSPGAMEFYLIMSGFMYVMYGNIGKEQTGCRQERARKYMTLQGSYIGLGVGFLSFMTSIAAVIASISSESAENGTGSGKPSQIFNGMTTCVYVLTIPGNLIAHFRMRRSEDWRVEDGRADKLRLTMLLLFISASGLFISSAFTIVASSMTVRSANEVLLLVHEALKFIDISVQVVFLYDVLHRKPPENFNPNFTRQIMMMLVFTNFMFWWANIYELKDVDVFQVQYCFYGSQKWSIVAHLTTPLEIYFRFHSCIMYLEIWMSG